jgi:hypothetical protein
VLVLRRVWIGQEVAAAAWVSVLAVCLALAVFLIAAEPTAVTPSRGPRSGCPPGWCSAQPSP